MRDILRGRFLEYTGKIRAVGRKGPAAPVTGTDIKGGQMAHAPASLASSLVVRLSTVLRLLVRN